MASTATGVPPTSSSKDQNRDYADVESTITRIQTHKGVQGIVIATHEGSVIRSTLDNIQTPQISTLVTQLSARAKGVVRDLDPEDEMKFLRIRSKKHEIMVASTKPYLLIVIQNPHEL